MLNILAVPPLFSAKNRARSFPRPCSRNHTAKSSFGGDFHGTLLQSKRPLVIRAAVPMGYFALSSRTPTQSSREPYHHLPPYRTCFCLLVNARHRGVWIIEFVLTANTPKAPAPLASQSPIAEHPYVRTTSPPPGVPCQLPCSTKRRPFKRAPVSPALLQHLRTRAPTNRVPGQGKQNDNINPKYPHLPVFPVGHDCCVSDMPMVPMNTCRCRDGQH